MVNAGRPPFAFRFWPFALRLFVSGFSHGVKSPSKTGESKGE